jgi:enoyl-CoA hydratase
MADKVTTELDGFVLQIGVDRQDRANAWDVEVIAGVCEALARVRDDDGVRAGVIFGHGKHFTGGLDLADVAPVVAGGDGGSLIPEGCPDPWGVFGEPCPKPIVIAAHGRCNTLGVELMAATQLAVASEDTVFAQLEVARGILPLGGATFRLPLQLGAAGMRLLLTAEDFDAAEAYRIGLICEVAPVGEHLEAGLRLAHKIAANAPLGVQASLANARSARTLWLEHAAADLADRIGPVMASADALEGVAAMMEKRPAVFTGN